MPDLPVPQPPGGVALAPSLVRAAVSPAAVAATVVGAGIGVLDRSAVLAAVLAGCGWAGRMVVAVVRRRRGGAVPAAVEVDPWSVPEPWRALLRQAVSAEQRFDRALGLWPAGPVRDRLVEMRGAVGAEVRRLGITARQGAAAAGWDGAAYAVGGPSVTSLREELRALQAEAARLGRDTGRREELARREEAVAAELRAAQRAEQVRDELHDRLRRAVARLDETVSELLLIDPAATGGGTGPFAGPLEGVSDGVRSLRAALDEAAAPPPDPTP